MIRRTRRSSIRKPGILALPLFLALFALPAIAGSIYVDPSGSDAAGSGDSANPFASIGAALAVVQDGDVIEVAPGEYLGQVDLVGDFPTGILVRSTEPLQARLRHNGIVLRCVYASGIALEGFDLAQTGRGSAGPLVLIRDERTVPGGSDGVRRITLRDNLLHDAFGGDLVRIEGGARLVHIEGNLLMNPGPSSASVLIDGGHEILMQDNVFAHDYAASGRPVRLDAVAGVIVRDRLGGEEGFYGSREITVRRNVFLDWQGSPEGNWVQIGEDHRDQDQARYILVENNLMLGNSPHPMRAPFGVMAARDVSLRSNTISGDLPSEAWVVSLGAPTGAPSQNVRFSNNAWSDPTGSMAPLSSGDPGALLGATLASNGYWNGGQAIPVGGAGVLLPENDTQPVIGDPRLPDPAAVDMPDWSCNAAAFADGSGSPRALFRELVLAYATPGPNSALLGAADPVESPDHDILGYPRSSAPSLGALESSGTSTAARDELTNSISFSLGQNHPNPFASRTAIAFALPAGNDVSLKIYNARGQMVRELIAGPMDAGRHVLHWDGRNADGHTVAAGAYVYRLVTADGQSQQRKLLHLR